MHAWPNREFDRVPAERRALPLEGGGLLRNPLVHADEDKGEGYRLWKQEGTEDFGGRSDRQ